MMSPVGSAAWPVVALMISKLTRKAILFMTSSLYFGPGLRSRELGFRRTPGPLPGTLLCTL
jgi:hypothetical protein